MVMVRNTVDRLDKPSAYFNAAGKRRHQQHNRRDEEEDKPQEPIDDPLKDATTLYVGNLSVLLLYLAVLTSS